MKKVKKNEKSKKVKNGEREKWRKVLQLAKSALACILCQQAK
jgi:hypothetical protein